MANCGWGIIPTGNWPGDGARTGGIPTDGTIEGTIGVEAASEAILVLISSSSGGMSQRLSLVFILW